MSSPRLQTHTSTVERTLECTIEKLVHGGDGLARLPAAAGEERRQVVFVPLTLPGERVRVEIGKATGGQLRGRLLEVLTPSPDRVTPGCEYFGRCGGCQLQHLAEGRQTESKRDILLETLARTGGIRWEGAVELHRSPGWAYRNRVRVQIAGPGRAGYHERESHRILPVRHCPIASPLLNRALAALAEGTAAPSGGARELELIADNADERLMADLETSNGLPLARELHFEVAGQRYRVSPGSFFQVNRVLTGELVDTVCGGESGTTAVDLFSGVGLFALPLARHFARVEAVEESESAFEDLERNTADVPQVRAVRQPALAYLRQRDSSTHEGMDLLVADPPRAGLGAAMVEAIAAQAPRRITLVACDPATLGRDLRPLTAAGYELREVHLLDLFPQTYHMETVVKLVRR